MTPREQKKFGKDAYRKAEKRFGEGWGQIGRDFQRGAVMDEIMDVIRTWATFAESIKSEDIKGVVNAALDMLEIE
jgi:hypothetical protein